jgi:hypothetical protein
VTASSSGVFSHGGKDFPIIYVTFPSNQGIDLGMKFPVMAVQATGRA